MSLDHVFFLSLLLTGNANALYREQHHYGYHQTSHSAFAVFVLFFSSIFLSSRNPIWSRVLIFNLYSICLNAFEYYTQLRIFKHVLCYADKFTGCMTPLNKIVSLNYSCYNKFNYYTKLYE